MITYFLFVAAVLAGVYWALHDHPDWQDPWEADFDDPPDPDRDL